MKFIMTFAWPPDTKARAEGIERFQKTGGRTHQESSYSAGGPARTWVEVLISWRRMIPKSSPNSLSRGVI
jgi:hypothetical protein